MGLTESVNNFDTKLNQITTDIFKEVEKITRNPLEAEQKKLSNLIPFLRDVYSTIAALKQSEKDLKKEKDNLQGAIREFQSRANEIRTLLETETGASYPVIVKPNDLNRIYTDIYNGSPFHGWNKKNLNSVWTNDIYPQLSSTRGWRTTLNGYYVLTGGKSYPSGEPVIVIEALSNPTTAESSIPWASKKELMTIE